MYTENCVKQAFLNCHFKWYILSLICNNIKQDNHTIRLIFKYDYKYAILLDKSRNGEDFISFLNLDTLYSGGWGKSPLPWDIFTSDIPYIQIFYIALLSYVIAYM